MEAPMIMASKATAPTTIPAIVPVEGPRLGFCIWAGDVIGGLVQRAGELVEDWILSVTDVVDDVEEEVLEGDLTNRDVADSVVKSVVDAAIDVVDAGFADTEEELVVELTVESSLVLVEDALLVLEWDVVNKE
jgi:hypothetical protein